MRYWKKFRLRAVMRFARVMRVPIDVHQSYLGANKPQQNPPGPENLVSR